MQARDIMTSPAITVTADTHIPEVARILRANQISGVPVVDGNGGLLGIVTDHDLIMRNAPVREPRYFAVLSGVIPINRDEYRQYKEQLRHTLAITAGDLIEPDVDSIESDTPLEKAMELMLDPRITMLPVIDQNKVIGVLTRTDLVRLIEELEGALDPDAALAEADEDPVLAGLGEVILYVQDMAAMVSFYRDMLGLRVEEPVGEIDLAAVSWVVLDTGAAKLALHSGGEGRLGEDTPSLVFVVADMEATRELLLGRGVELGEPFEAAPDVLISRGRDPEGHPFSLEART